MIGSKPVAVQIANPMPPDNSGTLIYLVICAECRHTARVLENHDVHRRAVLHGLKPNAHKWLFVLGE